MFIKMDALNLLSRRPFSCRSLILPAWVLGLFAGLWFGSSYGSGFVSLMRSALSQPVSIVGILAVYCFPFLLTAFAVLISRLELLVLLAFCKAFLFSACACLVELSFGSAGWLIRLLLVSRWITAPLLLWLWLYLADRREKSAYAFSVCALWGILAGALEYCYVSPFLAMLFE